MLQPRQPNLFYEIQKASFLFKLPKRKSNDRIFSTWKKKHVTSNSHQQAFLALNKTFIFKTMYVKTTCLYSQFEHVKVYAFYVSIFVT